MTQAVRNPAVAGLFYPADSQELELLVAGYLKEADDFGPQPKALIVPHAGFVYSGPVAASGYRLLEAARETVRRVILLGPAHRYPFHGLAAHHAAWFVTPLGKVRTDQEALEEILALPVVQRLDAAHSAEHSLEVHLPFLQKVLEDFRLVPLVVGGASVEEVAQVLEVLWGGPETLIVVSSDLSHYHDYETARRLDRATATAIEELRPESVGPQDACGCQAIGGLLEVARRKGLKVTTLDLRNSGDTAGSRGEVVGYGAFAFS
ncbi:MAG: AmmeMemoRadiSam system protein B [Planctomycetota bacterium]|jgi:AmmeMemoRadiSam system protein B